MRTRPQKVSDLALLLRQWWQARHQKFGFGRAVRIRRALAATFGLAALALMLLPAQRIPATGVLVAAHDLPAGSVLGTADVTVRELPTQAVPDGAAQAPGTVLGRVLAAPVRRGEPLTEVRLAGPELTRAVSMTPEAVSVPLRLADPGVAALLRPGLTVDVVTAGQREGEPVLLARGARVLAVLGASAGHRSGDGQLVLVALEPLAATHPHTVPTTNPGSWPGSGWRTAS